MSLNWQVGHRAYYNWKKLYCQAVDKSCYSKPMSLDKSLVAPLGKAKNELSHETNSISKVPPTNQHLSLVVNYYNWNCLKILRKGRNAGTASWPATSTSRTSRNLKLDVGSEFFRSSGAQTSASWPRTSGWSSAQPSLRTAEVTVFCISHFFRFSSAGLSVTLIWLDKVLDASSAAKWAWLLINHLIAAYLTDQIPKLDEGWAGKSYC